MMDSEDRAGEFRMAVEHLEGLVGGPVLVEISPSVENRGELCHLNRLRLSAADVVGDGLRLQFSSVSGDHIGHLEIQEAEVSWVEVKDTSIAFYVNSTYVEIWDWERLVKRSEHSDAELWELYGMPATSVTPPGGAGHAVDQLVGRIAEFDGRRLQIQIEFRRAGRPELVELLGVRGSIRDVDSKGEPRKSLWLGSEDGGRIGEITVYPDEVKGAELIEAGIKVDLGSVELKVWDAEYFGELD